MPVDQNEIRAIALFDEYVDMPAEEREAALHALAEQDPATHAALVRMLEADAGDVATVDATPFSALSMDGMEPEQPGLTAGTRLGAWQITHALGMGGMGAVYAALRADGQYEQKVAIKCLRTELATPRLIEAFYQERNVLAKIEHPNVARLLDGGIDAYGQPWFAMQFVQGQPIDQWCDQQQLTLRERVALLSRACEAVAYAHAKGVLHEDIKPSNLLVSDEGEPMLLDFGLAQIVSQDGGNGKPRLAFSEGYAAPETLMRQAPSPASDIYALGVVLYRLLCADWPVPPSTNPDLHSSGSPERPVHPPRAPATLAAMAPPHVARQRALSNPRALARQIAGDLDSIALRCVATRPEDRYASVVVLRDDLQRWLRHLPVAARNGGTFYRIGLNLRRHAFAATFATLALVFAATSASLLIWQKKQDHQIRVQTTALTRLFASVPGGATLPSWGPPPLNTPQSLQKSEQQLRTSSLAKDPAALARGLMITAGGYFAIGDNERGYTLLHEAEQLQPDENHQQARAQTILAQAYNRDGRYAQAVRAADEGLRKLKWPLTLEAKTLTVQLQAEAARSNWQLGDRDHALATLDRMLEQVDRAPETYPSALASQLLLLRSDWRNQLHEFTQGKDDADRALTLAGSSPTLAAAANEQLATALSETGETDVALKAATDNLEKAREAYGATGPQTGMAWIVLAEAQQAAGKSREALTSAGNALGILEPVLTEKDPAIARALRISALAQLFMGNPQGAVKDARHAVAIMNSMYGTRHEQSVRTRQALALSLGYLSETAADGSTYLQEALSLYADLLRDGESIGLPMSREWLAYGIRLGNSGQPQAAREALQRALPGLQREYGDDSDYVFEARRSLAALPLKEGHYEAARASLDEFATLLSHSGKSSLYRTVALSDTLLDLASIDITLGDMDSAKRHLNQALEINKTRFGADDAHTRTIRLTLARLEENRAAKVTAGKAYPD